MSKVTLDSAWFSSSSDEESISEDSEMIEEGEIDDLLEGDYEEEPGSFEDCVLCDKPIDTDVDVFRRCKTCDMVYCNPCVRMMDYIIRCESHQSVTRSFVDHRCLNCFYDYATDMYGKGIYGSINK